MPAPVIKVDNLVKRYGDTVAVAGISFAVERGVTAALLGGNGAGKTTTLSMLLGLLLPTEGGVESLGKTCCGIATAYCRGSIFRRLMSICRTG